ncbi:MAG: hypothetical protein IJ495_00985 [Bacteroidales bacterium]|nr:hypothetical protein [Bacteroidales bacterium]
MKKLFSALLFFCFVSVATAQEVRFFKYSHSVNANSSSTLNKYSKSSSKYFYITCVDGERFAEVHGSWSDAQTYANRYQRPSAFSSRYVQMTNMTDLVTGQPYILSEKYDLYEVSSGYEIYPRQFQKINVWGQSSDWSYGNNFYALSDCSLVIREKGSADIWHYYEELDAFEVEELIEVAMQDDPYNFDNIYISDTPTYNNTYDGGSSSGSNEGVSTREEGMYKQMYQKWVDVFNSALESLRLVKGSSSESSVRQTLRDEQKQMREIRMEAQQKGIYIPQAPEETMSF